MPGPTGNPNKLTIELVDVGGGTGKPGTPPGSPSQPPGTPPGPPAPDPNAVAAAEKARRAVEAGYTQDEFGQRHRHTDDYGILTEAGRKAHAASVPPDPGDDYEATMGHQKPEASVPIAREMTQAEKAQFDMNKAATEYAKKVAANLLTYDEAMGELTRQVRARGMNLTEHLRGQGMGTDRDATDHYADQFRDKVKAGGGAIPANAAPEKTEAEQKRAALHAAVQDIDKEAKEAAEKVKAGYLTYEEALRAIQAKAARQGMDFTEYLRRQRAIDTEETSADWARRQLDTQAKAAGAGDKIGHDPAKQKSAEQMQLAALATQNIFSGGGAGQKVAGGLQLAGSGMLGKGAAAFAGGPAGAAIQAAAIAVDVTDKIIGSVHEEIRASIKKAGQVTQSIAANDGLKAFTTGVDAAAEKLEKIPIVGKAVGEAMKTVTTAMTVAKESIDAFASRARELAQYNGPTAQAAAMADVKKIQADIAQANRFQEQNVKIIEAQARVDMAWRRATDPLRARIMTILAERIAPWLERLGNRVEGMATGFEIMLTIMENLDKLAEFDFTGFRDAIEKKVGDCKRELEKMNQPDADAGLEALKGWFDKLDGMELKPTPAGAVDDRGLKLPMFKGLK